MVRSSFLTKSFHFLLLQGFSATSQMFPPTLIKPLVLQRQKFLLLVAIPYLKPPGCPAPLVPMTFSQAAHLQILPDLRTSIRAGSRWEVAAATSPLLHGQPVTSVLRGNTFLSTTAWSACCPTPYLSTDSAFHPILKEHGFSPSFFFE